MRYMHPLHKNYSCDEFSNVFNKKDYKLIPILKSTGYTQYNIGGKAYLAHRFIMECFCDRLLMTNEVVNHLNFNRADNSKTNLEMVTTERNVQHYWENNTARIVHQPLSIKNRGKAGDKNPCAKLTKEEAAKVIMLSLQGYSNREISVMFNIHDRYVSLIRHKKRWKSLWIDMGLESSETIPSGSRLPSEWVIEAEVTSLLS